MEAISKKWNDLNNNYPNFNVLSSTFIFLTGLVIILSIASDTFFTTRNIINILTQSSIYMIVAVGMTLIMTTGGIDISVGSIVGLSTTFLGTMIIGNGYPWWFGILVCILIGIACGVFNGLFVVLFKVPPIIVTLGTLTMFRGLAYAYQEGTVFYGYPAEILWIARGRIIGIPVPVWLAAIAVIFGQYFLTKTKTGRHLTALGGNEEASRLAGINVKVLRFSVYVVMGIFAAITAVILSGRLDASQAVSGQGMELHVIAAVVVGGTVLSGGRGLMLGTLLGVLILGVLENGLLLAGVSYYWQRVFLGLIFVLVVAVRSFKRKKRVKIIAE